MLYRSSPGSSMIPVTKYRFLWRYTELSANLVSPVSRLIVRQGNFMSIPEGGWMYTSLTASPNTSTRYSRSWSIVYTPQPQKQASASWFHVSGFPLDARPLHVANGFDVFAD